jgi:hypothetical protein
VPYPARAEVRTRTDRTTGSVITRFFRKVYEVNPYGGGGVGGGGRVSASTCYNFEITELISVEFGICGPH